MPRKSRPRSILGTNRNAPAVSAGAAGVGVVATVIAGGIAVTAVDPAAAIMSLLVVSRPAMAIAAAVPDVAVAVVVCVAC